MKLSVIAIRNISRNKRRSILSGVAIGISAMFIVFAFSLIGGMKKDIADLAQKYITGSVRINHGEFDDLQHLNPMHLRVEEYQSLKDELFKLPEVTGFSSRINFPGIVQKDGLDYPVMGTAVDFATEVDFQGLEDHLLPGGHIPAADSEEILIGSGLAKELGVDVGDKITMGSMTMNRWFNRFKFRVAGLVEFPISAFNNTVLLAPLDRTQYYLRMDDSVSELLVRVSPKVDSKETTEKVKSILKELKRDELLATHWMDVGITMSWLEIAEFSYSIIAAIFFILGSTVIINTTMMVIFERMKEIGTLGAMGMEGGKLVKLFFMESFFIALVGAGFGVILGIILTQILSYTGIPLGNAMEGVDFDMPSIIKPQLSLRSTVFVYCYAVAVASFCSLIPSTKASSVEPVEALRHY